MDSKYKKVLQQHRPFLVKNIIWSPQLADMMKSHGLLTDFMISDINACEKREARIHKLIDVIPLRGSQSFNKFIDVLMLSGHVFIADFLQEDEDHQKLFDIKDMYKTLPFVQRAFNDKEKKEMEVYIAERIESQVLKKLWKRDNREKEKALEAKLKQIEQSYEFEVQYEAKAATISRLEKEISASLDDKQELKAKLAALANAHREMEVKHKEALAVQMRYNAANDNTIERAKEKINELESVLRQIHSRMESMLKTKNSKSAKSQTNNKSAISNGERRDSTDTLAEKISIEMARKQYSYVLNDLESFIKEYNALLEVRTRYEKLLEERDYILIHFGFSKNDQQSKAGGNMNSASQDQEPSLVKAYKDFALRNDENIMKMRKEIEKYDGLLEENKAKLEDLAKEKDDSSRRFALGASSWQSAIMSVMRKQLQDTKTDLRKKESMMSMQEEEMNKLKSRINELEQQVSSNPSNQDLLSVHPRDMPDGRLSAASMDSVELIPSETPKPAKTRNLPPLKSSKSTGPKAVPATTSPRGTVMRSTKGNNNQFVSSIRAQAEPVNNYITFPIGPISAQVKPETRGRPMGSVLGELKAMNKHFNKPIGMLDDTRVARKPHSNTSHIKL